jgi:ribonuclease P protein component
LAGFFLYLQNFFNINTKLTLNRAEKLKKESLIAHVFAKGQAIFVHPIKCIFTIVPLPLKADAPKILIGVSVSKKKFKKATDRNTVKRKINELYRLNKLEWIMQVPEDKQVHVFFMFVSTEIPIYQKLETKWQLLQQKFEEGLKNYTS